MKDDIYFEDLLFIIISVILSQLVIYIIPELSIWL